MIENDVKLLASIVETRKEKTVIIIIIFPLILFGYAMFVPHFGHPDHIPHIAIHETGLLISGFLFSMTLLAYKKTKLPRMLFSTSAFAVLTIAQGVYLFLEQSLPAHETINYFSANEIFDILIVVMTVLFALGVFYNSNKQNFRI